MCVNTYVLGRTASDHVGNLEAARTFIIRSPGNP